MEIFGTNINFFGRKREVVPETTQQREAPAPIGVPESTNEKKDSGVTGGSYQERIVYARSPETALTVSAV